MAGEAIRDYGSWVLLEDNGGSISNNAFAAADDLDFDFSSDGGNRLHAEFEIEFAFTTAPTANTSIGLFARNKNIFGGTNTARDPSANHAAQLLRSVIVDAVGSSTIQRQRFDVINAPRNARYFLQNANTGQSINAGWKLRMRAWSPKVA